MKDDDSNKGVPSSPEDPRGCEAARRPNKGVPGTPSQNHGLPCTLTLSSMRFWFFSAPKPAE